MSTNLPHFVLNTAGGSTTGFATIRQGSQLVNGHLCHNMTYETITVWNCNSMKIWDPSSTDVSGFVLTVSKLASNCSVSLS